jgi:hypothetical protein
MADKRVTRRLLAASDDFDESLGCRCDAGGGGVGYQAIALQVAEPGQKAGESDRRQREHPAGSRMELKPDQQESEVATAQRVIDKIMPPFRV